jgi:DNA repair exonuclease SbcCD ATPase subunit
MMAVRTPEVTDRILQAVAEAKSLREIAAEYGVSMWTLQKFLMTEVREGFADAKRASAEQHIANAVELLEQAAGEAQDLTAAQASIARSRSELQVRMAQVRNREEYSDKPQLNVSMSFGEMFMEALQLANQAPKELPSGAHAQDAEFEVL